MLKFLFINKREKLCALYYFCLTTKKMKFYYDNKTIFGKPTDNLKIEKTQLNFLKKLNRHSMIDKIIFSKVINRN